MFAGCVGVADRDIVCMVRIAALAHLMRSMVTPMSSAIDFDWIVGIDGGSVSAGVWGTFAPNGTVRTWASTDFGHCICWSSSNR